MLNNKQKIHFFVPICSYFKRGDVVADTKKWLKKDTSAGSGEILGQTEMILLPLTVLVSEWVSECERERELGR